MKNITAGVRLNGEQLFKQYLKKIDKLLHNELILKENLKKMRSELDELL